MIMAIGIGYREKNLRQHFFKKYQFFYTFFYEIKNSSTVNFEKQKNRQHLKNK
jgi:hypothetical protein